MVSPPANADYARRAWRWPLALRLQYGVPEANVKEDHLARPLARTRQPDIMRVDLAVESAGLGVWEYKIATGCVALSPRARTAVGLPPSCGSVTLDELLVALHPEDRDRWRAAVRTALDATRRTPCRIVCRVRFDGNERIVMMRGRAYFSGRIPLGMIGVIDDQCDREPLRGAGDGGTP